MTKIFSSRFFFLIFIIVATIFLIGLRQSLKSFISISGNRVEFVDFPKTRKGEMGLLDGFNIDFKKAKKLIDKGKVEVKNNLYQITQIQILNQDLTAYEMEIKDKNNDEKSFMSKNDYPSISGIIIFNKKSGKAIQLYYASIWLDTLGGDLIPIYLEDINLDKNLEFIIKTYKGGNSVAANQYYIFQVDSNDNFKFLNPDIRDKPQLNISEIFDYDFDNNWEIIVSDNTWEITRCTDHSDGPISYSIYSWKDGVGYVENSINYQKYYQNIIDDDISKRCSGLKDFCFGPALKKYFAYKMAGRENEGWKKFLELTKGVKNRPWPSEKCLNYVIKLHDSEQDIVPPKEI